MTNTRLGASLTRGIAIACVLGLLVAGALWWTLQATNSHSATAYFPRTVGLYEGNDVRVLGVQAGEVTSVEPQGDQVKVGLEYDRSTQVPAGAQAVLVAPSLVSDRYVQLAPAYTGGPEMQDGAVIPMERTVVPLEVDDLTSSLSEVSESLGPKGANKNGSLSNVLNTLAQNFEGNGQAVHDTITRLGQAAGTLSGNKDDLFATVQNLGNFSTTLANSDSQVRRFEQQLADVSGFLSGERGDLAATVQQLGTTLESVQGFIENNRGRLKSNVDKLSGITKVLVDQRTSLAEILDVAPPALSNVVNAYNAGGGTLDARPDINELTNPPVVLVCKMLGQLPAQLGDLLGDTCKSIEPVVSGLAPLPSAAQTVNALQTGELPPLPLPLVGQMYGSPQPGGDQ